MIIWMLIGYMWLYIHRPFEVWWWLGSLHVERIYMVVTLIVWLVSPKSLVGNKVIYSLFGFVIVFLLCWSASPYMGQTSLTVENYIKVVVFYVLLITTISNEQDLKKVITAFLACVFLYMLHSLWEFHCGRHVYRMGIPRMIGIDAMYNDPNTFSATLIYALPMVYPFWHFYRHSKWARRGVLGYIGLSVLCILLTGSRTSFVGLMALGGMLVCMSRHRFRIAAALVILAPVIFIVLPAEMQNRYLTIVDSSVGPANAAESMHSRLVFLEKAADLWIQSPVVGYGPGSFPYASGLGMQVHSLYGQLLGELGILGILAFLLVLLTFFFNAVEIYLLCKDFLPGYRPFSYYVGVAVTLSVLLLLLMGMGGHNLYRYTWLWYGAFQAIALRCAHQQKAALDVMMYEAHRHPPMNAPQQNYAAPSAFGQPWQ